MVRTQIQLTEEQAKALRKMAASRHLSSAELIRRAVDVMIKSGPAADPEERRKRAIEIAGKFSSGRSDVSRKHDKYLADAFGK
ncbi:MAG: ribbon-helix-helix protein, CopG family [Nitrospirae bacterium]|nr:ribbon-helix-helix protein, CopG family [Nitrospirota bacterium]